jgi:diaminohydroxyphosphoribosylaminopyrimidine deaminase/5-amino-6-(5-phosphoribosylamino)uracil reductase
MGVALRLARRAEGQTSPNPLVGAVIVRRGRLIGSGWHRRAGAPHAEIEALRQAGRRARGATLYSTLEPCNHTGRTDPCCEAIVAAGLSRVVAGVKDPNPITNGQGIARLRRHRIRTVVGVRQDDAERLIAPFRKAVTSGLPFVVAKTAQSLDGKIATASARSRWISSAPARAESHRLRATADAILVGIETVLADDPRLSVRHGRGRRGRPVKIIVDSHLRTPPAARCLGAASPAPVIIATTVHSPTKAAKLMRRGAEIIRLPVRRGRVPLRLLFRRLAVRGLHTLLIEGGGEVLAGALAERLVDRIVFFVAPVLIGGRTAPSSVSGRGIARLSDAIRLSDLHIRRIGPDLRVDAAIVYPRAKGEGRRAKGRANRSSRAPHPSPYAPR